MGAACSSQDRTRTPEHAARSSLAGAAVGALASRLPTHRRTALYTYLPVSVTRKAPAAIYPQTSKSEHGRPKGPTPVPHPTTSPRSNAEQSTCGNPPCQ